MPIKIGQVYPSLPVIPFVSICVWINICGEGLCSTIPKGQFFSRSLTYIWPNFHISPTLHSWRSRHAFSLLSRPLEPRLLNRNMLCNMFFEAMKDGWCIQGVKKKNTCIVITSQKQWAKQTWGRPKMNFQWVTSAETQLQILGVQGHPGWVPDIFMRLIEAWKTIPKTNRAPLRKMAS